MIIPVHMLAFQNDDSVVRQVDVPDTAIDTGPIAWVLQRENTPADLAVLTKATDELLGLVFHYGQNEQQNVPGICSVSAGDVVELGGQFFMVQSFGFAWITAEQYAQYLTLPREQRHFSKFVRGRIFD